jgi:hypothetical protein
LTLCKVFDYINSGPPFGRFLFQPHSLIEVQMQQQDAQQPKKALGATRQVSNLTTNAVLKLNRHVKYLAILNGCPEFLKDLPKDPIKRKNELDKCKLRLKEFYELTDLQLAKLQGVQVGSLCGPQKAREYLKNRMIELKKARMVTSSDNGPSFPIS